jgi:hypothetical protein
MALARPLAGARRLRWLPFVGALVVAAASGGQGQELRNGATWYRLAFERLDSIQVSNKEWEAIEAFQADPSMDPPDELRAVLARSQTVFNAVRRGSRRAYSDFGLDYGQGFDLRLPHLAQLRRISILMSADAMLRLGDGDSAGAGHHIASLYGVAGHLGADGVIISSLVGQAVFRAADRVTRAGLDRGAFGAAESEGLAEALAVLGTGDPFQLVQAIENDRALFVAWIREKYADAGANDRSQVFDELGLNLGPAGAVAGLMLLEEGQFERDLQETDQLMQRVTEAFGLEDPVETRFELNEIEEAVGRGEHGVLAMILPSYTKLYEWMTEAQDVISERSAQMEAIAAGRVTPEELANAAVWYLRAIESFASIDRHRWEQLRRVVADPPPAVGDDTARILIEAEPIIETLRRGSRIVRCDFSIARGAPPPALPGYLPGLRDAARLLNADASRLLGEREVDAAADRLAICYRISAHLAGDEILSSSRVSQVIFAATDALREGATRAGGFSDTQRSALVGAVRAMGRRDPFGYVASVNGARAQVRRWVEGQTRSLDGERPWAGELVSRCDADRLLYLLVVSEASAAGGASGPPDPAASLSSLDDVLSLENLARTRARAAEDLGLVQSGEVDRLLERAALRIAAVQEGMESARADLRRAVLGLKTGKGRRGAGELPTPNG